MKKSILITIDWFDPAYKAGGPISSVVNLINHLHEEFEFYILTGALDYGSDVDFDSVECNKWLDWKGMAQVYYMSTHLKSRKMVFNVLKEKTYDYYYVQGIFSLNFSIYPLLWWKQYSTGLMIVAPRGMLHSTALSVKPFKKRLFLTITKFMGWYDDVFFHSTDSKESSQIRNNFRQTVKIKEASMLPKMLNIEGLKPREKITQQLNLVCVSRISKEKNILFLLEVLKNIDFPIRISFLGPFEDNKYFETFISTLSRLPDNIFSKYYGNVKPKEISNILIKNHVFVSPSLGENYGHAIAEALTLGLPAIISKNTPWTGLSEGHAGNNLPLEVKSFVDEIEKFYNMNTRDFTNMQRGAHQYIKEKINLNKLKEQYRNIFN